MHSKKQRISAALLQIKEHVIEFTRYGRKANLTLPWKSGKSCEFLLKAPSLRSSNENV
jgi:hypothetical protein